MACVQISDHRSKIRGSPFQFAHTFNLLTKTIFGWEGRNPCFHCLYIISDRQLLPICAEKVQCHADADLRSKAPLRGLTLPLYTRSICVQRLLLVCRVTWRNPCFLCLFIIFVIDMLPQLLPIGARKLQIELFNAIRHYLDSNKLKSPCKPA